MENNPKGTPTFAASAPKPRQRLDADQIYRDTLAALRSTIESDYGSLRAFCDRTGIDRSNLSKAFTADRVAAPARPGVRVSYGSIRKTDKRDKDLSVGLYLRICVILRLVDICEVSDVADADYAFNMSLRDYLLVNHYAVSRSVLHLNTTA
jgi:hypothetical protein